MTYSLPSAIATAFDAALADWNGAKISQFWNRDKTLWTNTAGKEAEDLWLGWLTIVEEEAAQASEFRRLAEFARASGCANVVVLGMGGSSLAPEVISMSFGRQPGYPALHILDSTDPAQVLAIEKACDPKNTLYIVASKSGSTLEPNVFKAYFFDRAGKAGGRFIAITDPGSGMEKVAKDDKFAEICMGVPSIGGRFSALSKFGMVPAALMGLDVPHLLSRADQMVTACKDPKAADNPGVALGVLLGTLWKNNCDKLTFVISPAVHDLGAWLEQLIAESTGKTGKVILPVDREPVGPPSVYGSDRVFAYVRYSHLPDAIQEDAVLALEKAGHPVIRINIADTYDLGAEFFRWEVATAIAGSMMGINPFNQPDVEASKIETRELTTAYEANGAFPAEQPVLDSEGLKFYVAGSYAGKCTGGNAVDILRAHLGNIETGDYFALLAYINMTADHEESLTATRVAIRDAKKAATCLGFGPRFLHSTGQGYKGGSNKGVFLQITCDDTQAVPIPGTKLNFSVVKEAQARGDFRVLDSRGRRALRVHLPADVAGGLKTLDRVIREALVP